MIEYNKSPIIGYDEYENSKDILIVYDHSEIKDISTLRFCPYCSSMNIFTYETGLCKCTKCGWWKIVNLADINKGWGSCECSSKNGILKKYDVTSIDTPLSLLKENLIKHPANFGDLNPFKLEDLVENLFKDFYAPCEVIHVGGNHDKGIDLKLILSDKETYLVQIKCRKKHR